MWIKHAILTIKQNFFGFTINLITCNPPKHLFLRRDAQIRSITLIFFIFKILYFQMCHFRTQNFLFKKPLKLFKSKLTFSKNDQEYTI